MKGWARILVLGGCLMFFMGVVWAAQGSGYFPYPRRSFMVNDPSWIVKGLVFALLGAVLAFFSARKMR